MLKIYKTYHFLKIYKQIEEKSTFGVETPGRQIPRIKLVAEEEKGIVCPQFLIKERVKSRTQSVE